MADNLTRCDAFGESLTEDERFSLYSFAMTPIGGDADAGVKPHRPRWPEEVAQELAARGIEIPSRSGWYRFLSRVRARDIFNRRAFAIQASGENAGRIAGMTPLDPLVAAQAFDAMAVDAGMSDDDDAAAKANLYATAAQKIRDGLLKSQELEIRNRAQATKDEQLKLAREKFEAAEKRIAAASKTVADETLTDEQRVAKIKSIFGIR